MKLMVFSAQFDLIEQEKKHLESLVNTSNISSEFYNLNTKEGMCKAIQYNVFGPFQMVLVDDANKVCRNFATPGLLLNELQIPARTQ